MNRSHANDLERLVAEFEADSCLLEEGQLKRRIEALDRLDAYVGNVDWKSLQPEAHIGAVYERAELIRARFEDVNSRFYKSIRERIQIGYEFDELFKWIFSLPGEQQSRDPAPGLSYDYLDELVSGILRLKEPEGTSAYPDPEMVFYQPTPARHVIDLISSVPLSDRDVLIDLGSGLGHVPILVSMFTGVRSIGIEVEAGYVASAQRSAWDLGLERVTFIREDARTADLSSGTVFYLYSPFTGKILSAVMRRLKDESANRPIRICTFGPCTLTVANASWLESSVFPATDRIVTFVPRG